ncbi:MAG: hypothetical protein WDM89_10070 [Rhizomicrobium sp.]
MSGKAKLLERQIGLFRHWTNKNARVEVTYEQVASDLGKDRPAEHALTKFLNTGLKKPFNPRVQKVTPPLREVVENFAELKMACEEAALGHLVS